MTEVFLMPGDWVTVNEPAILKTILGSCVAVALFDPHSNVAGLNHYLLPEVQPGTVIGRPGRYGDRAIEGLLRDMASRGANMQHLQAKIFGGGAVVQALVGDFNVGDLNIALARNALKSVGIPIVGEDVGGKRSRYLTFHTDDFTTEVSEIERTSAPRG